MGLDTTQSEARLANLMQERETLQMRAEVLLDAVNQRTGDDKALTEAEQELQLKIRDRVTQIDTEVEVLTKDVISTREAMERANELSKMILAGQDGITHDDDGIVYRDFAAYARDEILTRGSSECQKVVAQLGNDDEVVRARERLAMLKARVNNTLSSNVGGLIPPQHIAQIFQIIDESRPLVAAATKAALERGQLTYPKVTTRP